MNMNDKILEKKRQIKNLQRQQRRNKRKKRKIKLLKLGGLFLILNLLDETQEVILGFLKKYKNLSEIEKNEYKFIGKAILSQNNKKYYSEDFQERKKMFYKMIKKAALFEKIKIHKEDPTILLGFLNSYKNLSEIEKNKFFDDGKKEFINKSNLLSNEEKLELLKLSIYQKKDLTSILKKNYQKTIHDLQKYEFEEIKKILM